MKSTGCPTMMFDSCPRTRRTRQRPGRHRRVGPRDPGHRLGVGHARPSRRNRPSARGPASPNSEAAQQHGRRAAPCAADAARRRRSSAAGRRLPRGQFLLDQLAVRGAAAVELPDQPHGAAAQAARHLLEVLLGHLAHRPVELQFLDRPQHQRLLALERRARPPAQHLGRVHRIGLARAATACGTPRNAATPAAITVRHTNTTFAGPRAAHGDRRRRRREQRPDDEQVPRLEAGHALVRPAPPLPPASSFALVEVSELIVEPRLQLLVRVFLRRRSGGGRSRGVGVLRVAGPADGGERRPPAAPSRRARRAGTTPGG